MNPETESPPRYEIATVHDFLQVPADRIGDCLKEFAEFLEFCREFDAQVKAILPDDFTGEAIAAKKFTWIDDGARDVKITLSAEVPA